MNSGSILVVNAGSSSLKFSIFRQASADTLQLALRGQIDGLGARPHLRVKDARGAVLDDRDYTIAIVTRGTELMNPNHYLAAAIYYLFTHRPGWRADAAIGKTVVSSRVIDLELNRTLRAAGIGLLLHVVFSVWSEMFLEDYVCRELSLLHTRLEGGRCSNSTWR